MTDLSTTGPRTADVTLDSRDQNLWQRLLYVGPTGIVVAVALSVVEWTLLRSPENGAGIAATLAALAMTAPVVLARRMPLTAVIVLALAALANGLVFGGELVRCAGAFPAVVYAAYAVGAYSRGTGRGWGRPVTGLAVAVAALVFQYAWDKVLHADAAFLAMGPAVALLAWGLGLGWAALSRRRASA